MIFYFTGTGNSLEVARVIAEETADRLVDIGAHTKRGEYSFAIEPGEAVGFVFPVYLWAEPAILADFLKQLRLSAQDGLPVEPGYLYAVATYNRSPGQAVRLLDNRLKAALGLSLNAAFAVKSVGNYLPLYAPPKPNEQNAILEQARTKARSIAQSVRNREHCVTVEQPLRDRLLSRLVAHKEWRPSTSEFFTNNACTGCGQCERICPMNVIEMQNGRPCWSTPSCTRCLACLHRCPASAIQCGEHTSERTRYVNPVMSSGK